MWTITTDKVENGKRNGTVGPRGATLSAATIQERGAYFRMLDDDDEVYYYGRAVLDDDASGFEPLDDFGTPNAGCTSIQYFERGDWRTL